MTQVSGRNLLLLSVVLLLAGGLFLLVNGQGMVSAQVPGIDVIYTTDADFDQGTLVSVNHDSPNNDQLQLDQPTEPFPFINVAASGRGTMVRINTETGEPVTKFAAAPVTGGSEQSTPVAVAELHWTDSPLVQPETLPEGTTIIGLSVAPETIKLTSPFDYSQLLVSATTNTGDVIDVTRIASVQQEGAAVVVTESGFVRANADGNSNLTITLGDQVAKMAVIK